MRAEGDAALIELTRRFDGLDLEVAGIRVAAAEIEAARAKIDAKTLAALELAHERILDHHKRQLPNDDRYTDATGRRARQALDAGCLRRALCPGRHGELSELGA